MLVLDKGALLYTTETPVFKMNSVINMASKFSNELKNYACDKPKMRMQKLFTFCQNKPNENVNQVNIVQNTEARKVSPIIF